MQSLVNMNLNAEDTQVEAGRGDRRAGSGRRADRRNPGESDIHSFTKHTCQQGSWSGGVRGTGDTAWAHSPTG